MKISLTGAKPFTGKIIAETALFPQQLRGGLIRRNSRKYMGTTFVQNR